MAAILYHTLSSSALLSLGLYHLISTTCSYLKSPHSYSAKPFHPFPPSSSSSATRQHRLRHIQLYLIIVCLLVALIHQLIISSESDPLLKGSTPVHCFTSLQSAAVLFLFLILTVALLLSRFLNFSALPDRSHLCPRICRFLPAILRLRCRRLRPNLRSRGQMRLHFRADFGPSLNFMLNSRMSTQALRCRRWIGSNYLLAGIMDFQTGLSLYVEEFIPEGCHRLLDVVNGVEGSTKCDVDESKFRAMALLDLVFLVHVMFVVLIVMITYAVVAKSVGVRRLGSYEALPTSAASENNHSHIQMKALTGTQA